MTFFKTQCMCTWSKKVLKRWCHSDANIKTSQEVKITKFKLLKHFSSNSQPKQNKTKKKKKRKKKCIYTLDHMQLKMTRVYNTHGLM